MGQLNIGICIKIDMNPSLSGGGEPEEWYLTSTAESSDVLAAWQSKGADDYAASLVNLNNPGTLNLTQVASTVPWTVGDGWNFDQANYFDTGFKADGVGDKTFIVRVKDATAGKPTFGDGGPHGIQMVAALSTKWLLTNQSTDTLYDVTSIADDAVIALAGDQLYIDGSLIGTMVGYSPAVGSVNVFLGGVSGVPGDGTVAASAMYNRELTSTEVASITTKMQAL